MLATSLIYQSLRQSISTIVPQQIIYYDATMEMMEALINRSISCEQKLGYDCKRSRDDAYKPSFLVPINALGA
jgi:hypothetical protein